MLESLLISIFFAVSSQPFSFSGELTVCVIGEEPSSVFSSASISEIISLPPSESLTAISESSSSFEVRLCSSLCSCSRFNFLAACMASAKLKPLGFSSGPCGPGDVATGESGDWLSTCPRFIMVREESIAGWTIRGVRCAGGVPGGTGSSHTGLATSSSLGTAFADSIS